jgi:8-oxo-dGTP pyrophosphatase MutT (NUDIX family)
MSSDDRPVHEYEAAGGVVVRGNEVLLLWRPGLNEIRLPKGHVEPGETRLEAALREVREEGGVAHPRPVADLGQQRVEFDHAGVHCIRDEFYYLMDLEDAEPFPRDAKDAAEFYPFWASLAQAEAFLTFPSEREFLRRARAALEKG